MTQTKRRPNRSKQFDCSDCGEAYELRRTPPSGRPLLCSLCLQSAARARARNKRYWERPEYKRKARAWRMKKLYQISEEDYLHFLDLQGGVCAICKSPPTEGKSLNVDHDHQKNHVRGLLCAKCNRALGVFGDDTALLRQAESYLLRQPKSRPSWDEHFIEFARLTATRSKDPSTQVGAVIVREKVILSTGYNGFPRGVNDDISERLRRPTKYLYTVHAEENAILNAARFGTSVMGAILYITPIRPCGRCAAAIIQAGISEIVLDLQQNNDRWSDEMREAENILRLGKVLVR